MRAIVGLSLCWTLTNDQIRPQTHCDGAHISVHVLEANIAKIGNQDLSMTLILGLKTISDFEVGKVHVVTAQGTTDNHF